MRKTIDVDDRRFKVYGPIGTSTNDFIKKLKGCKKNCKLPDAPPNTKCMVTKILKKNDAIKEKQKETIVVVPFSTKDIPNKIPKSWVRSIGNLKQCRIFHRGMLKGVMNIISMNENEIICGDLKKREHPLFVRRMH